MPDRKNYPDFERFRAPAARQAVDTEAKSGDAVEAGAALVSMAEGLLGMFRLALNLIPRNIPCFRPSGIRGETIGKNGQDIWSNRSYVRLIIVAPHRTEVAGC